MLRSIFENNFKNIFTSQAFLFWSCLLVFAFSIYLRSMIDVGADTAVYLNIGEKVAKGGRYYYDFFESNFPISFWFYALQYQISNFLNINPIILSEIFINLLALGSIFWSAKILKSSTIYENRAYYNLIIISYFLGFFLRPIAISIGEFGTKTSLVLILFYPYLSYSFYKISSIQKSDLIYRGILMGLIPCIKPHYLSLILFIELYKICKKGSALSRLRYFIELDKLIMLLIGIIYLFLMLKFTPEFFEFMVPMWSKTYISYSSSEVFVQSLFENVASYMAIFIFIFLIFARLKPDENDKILIFSFIGVSFLILIESASTIDQVAVFFAIITICFSKFLFDIFKSRKFSFIENKFIIIALIFLPIFDMKNLPLSIFGIAGFINIWWLFAPFYPIYLQNKRSLTISKSGYAKFLFLYFALLLLSILSLKHFGEWGYIATNLLSLFAILFLFEKKVYSKISNKFSVFSIFVITTCISCLLYFYLKFFAAIFIKDETHTLPYGFYDSVAHYSKKYAPNKDDKFLAFSTVNSYQLPIANYLDKSSSQKFHIGPIITNRAKTGTSLMFLGDEDVNNVFSYLLDDMKNVISDEDTKIIFIDNTYHRVSRTNNRCLIGVLEYYFMDPKFKKVFNDNFYFKNRVIGFGKLLESNNKAKNIKENSQRVTSDFEIYVRKK